MFDYNASAFYTPAEAEHGPVVSGVPFEQRYETLMSAVTQ